MLLCFVFFLFCCSRVYIYIYIHTRIWVLVLVGATMQYNRNVLPTHLPLSKRTLTLLRDEAFLSGGGGGGGVPKPQTPPEQPKRKI